MTHLTVDENLHTKLLDLSHPVELCLSNGRVIGRFFPIPDPALYKGLECPFSREEIDRRKREMHRENSTRPKKCWLN